ncbi:MAG: ImmA/IrrE family metallo-endopeptidase [Chloroflexota bacterium]|nr:ImmA/IrrE family metallo-endopeptidase [Chloroflexota bacterium]MDE2884267.1 ImmA/IrrE family metallo-endopeptidase [Chloroflexota bacterium]
MVTETPSSTDWVTPFMLRWEREQVGLTVPYVADHLKVNVSLVHAWEDGDALPLLADLRLLAELYLCPVGHFFLDAPPPEPRQLDFRGLDPDKKLTYESHKTLRRFLRYVEVAGDWMEMLGLSKVARIPEFPLHDPAEAAQQAVQLLGVTQEVRESWDSPDEAFAGWRQAVEQCGVFVFSMTLPFGGVRGASTWPEDGVPGILVNHWDTESATGRVFTLLHEFAHILAHRAGLVCDFRGQPNVETFANRLAARAIVPFDALHSRLSDLGLRLFKEYWTESELNLIREPFHASRDVVAISLEDMKLAPDGYYRKQRTAWEKRRPFGRGRGGGQKRVVLKYRELGSRMSDLVLAASESGIVSPLDVDDVLGTPVKKFRDFIRAGST